MISSIFFQPNLHTTGIPGASELLIAIILAGLFCNICKRFSQLHYSPYTSPTEAPQKPAAKHNSLFIF